MIRVAGEKEILRCKGSEAAIRIVALCKAYGDCTRFLQFFADDDGVCMSLMDGVAVVHAPDGLNDEWLSFLNMHSDVRCVRADARVGAQLSSLWDVEARMGDFMTYCGGAQSSAIESKPVSYENLYVFLSPYFLLPPFDAWYVDVSHRVRHGLCHSATIVEEGQIVCNAMTVAETEQDALLGAVATHPDWRRRGLAGACVRSLIWELSDRTVHISPVDENARRLYESIGFVVSGSWSELTRR